MEFNEKVWLRAAIKGIRPTIEYKINTGEEIDFKGLVIREKQNLRKWWEIHAAQSRLPEVSRQIGHIG